MREDQDRELAGLAVMGAGVAWSFACVFALACWKEYRFIRANRWSASHAGKLTGSLAPGHPTAESPTG